MPILATKKKQKVNPLIYDTYLSVIKNSVGSKMFRNFYSEIGGKKTDIMRNGALSCAFYVSSILVLFKLAKKVHGTVDATVKDLRTSGWKIVKKPQVGSVLVWGKVDFGNKNIHEHIEFYIGNKKAISNRYEFEYPVKHHWTFGAKRKIELMLWNPKLLRG